MSGGGGSIDLNLLGGVDLLLTRCGDEDDALTDLNGSENSEESNVVSNDAVIGVVGEDLMGENAELLPDVILGRLAATTPRALVRLDLGVILEDLGGDRGAIGLFSATAASSSSWVLELGLSLSSFACSYMCLSSS